MDINLLIAKTSGQKKKIPINRHTTILGRGAECDLRIPIDSCSRKHCRITLQGDTLRVKDMGSSNGTFVNNQRVEESYLSAGDKLTIGPVAITIQIDGKPADSGGGLDTVPFSRDDNEIDALSAAADGADINEDPISALEALADIQEDEE